MIAGLVLLLLGTCAPAQPVSGEYVIGPKDLLQIRVLEVPELNVDRRVSDDGSIELPMVGQVRLGGLTPKGASDRLLALLTSKYVNRANVTVTILEYSASPIAVLGAVAKPGALTVSGRWDLQQAILAAGGVTSAAGKRVRILRRSSNGLSDLLEVSLDELLVQGSSLWNVPIFPSDVITVVPRSAVRIFCIGEFKTPGVVEFDADDRITLLTLVAKAGGFSDRAARGSIRIRRKTPDGKDEELVVDFKRVLAGKDPDPALKADDIVIVKESLL